MPSGFPPGPRDWLLGLPQLMRLRADLLGYYSEIAEKYGDVVLLRLGPYRDYVLFHPDHIREVMTTKAKSFPRWAPVLRVLRQWNGNSVLIAEGDEWRRQRRMVQPAFAARRFGRYAECVAERVDKVADRLAAEIAASGSAEVEMVAAMTDLTLEVISKTLFDTDLTEWETVELRESVAVLSELAVREMSAAVRLPDWLPLPGKIRKRRAMRLLDAMVRRVVRERRASGVDRGDLLSTLVLAADDEGDGARLTEEQVRDQTMTLLLAGHDTTAAALVWVFHCLAKHPAVAEAAAAEAESVLAGRAAAAEDAPRLALVERVVKEAMRLYPPAIGVLPRQAAEDVEVGGWMLPAGSLVHIPMFVTHRDPRWFPDPERFDPDRFLPERVDALPPFAYFPFGGGPRVCAGSKFAMMEAVLITATLLSRFRVEHAPGQGEPALVPGMSLRPKGGLRLRWTVRSGSRRKSPVDPSAGLRSRTCTS